MKELFTLSYFVFLSSYSLFSQSVGIGTNSPNASAQLDITATNKGLLIPRMNTAAITAISNPAKGLMVLDTAKNQLVFNIGTSAAPNWQTIVFNSGWGTSGNAGTNAATNFIGTTDDADLIFKRNNAVAGWVGASNTSLGIQTLNPLASTAAYNTAMGGQSLFENTTGSYNTAYGFSALTLDTSGALNTAIGAGALFSNRVGSANNAFGYQSLFFNQTGSNNTAIGHTAGLNTLGSSNVFIGFAAGQNETGSNKLYITNDATDANNTLLYGEFDNRLLRSNGRMEINSDNTLNDGLRVIKNYANATNKNSRAIYGENIVDDNWGIGVEGKGGRVGVQGQSAGIGNSLTYTGVKGVADGVNAGTNMGVWGTASGAANSNVGLYGAATGNAAFKYGLSGFASGPGINYGVYAIASSGTTNYAGYFDGNVFANGKLTITTTAGATGIDLSTSDAYAEMRVIRNTLNATDKDVYVGFGSPASSGIHLYSDESETVTIKSGLVGVGKAPFASNNYSRLQVKQRGNQNGIGVEAYNSTNHWDFFTTSDDASNLSMYYNGAYRGAFDNVNGFYTAGSDRRLKKDITLYQPVLNNVMQLQAYQYHYLDNQPTDRFSNGFMAQDVQKLFPDAVVKNTMKDGQARLGINYQYFTVLAIKGLQEQQQQIQSQEERIAKLEALVKTLAEKK